MSLRGVAKALFYFRRIIKRGRIIGQDQGRRPLPFAESGWDRALNASPHSVNLNTNEVGVLADIAGRGAICIYSSS